VDVTAPGAIGKNPWKWYAVITALLLLVCYWPTISGTIQVLVNTGDTTRAIFPPVVAAYVIFARRAGWQAIEIAPSVTGLAVLLVGAVLSAVAILGGSLTLSRIALIVSFCGCILVICGVKALQLLLSPLVLLLFSLPIPAPLYHIAALPLQAAASRGAEVILSLLRFHAIRAGDSIYMPSQILVVSEACSGIQSLLTLSFFCLIYGYWTESRVWLRAFLVAASLPALVVMNIIRVTITGVVGEFDHKYTQGAWHSALGYVTLVVAFCLILTAHTLILRKLQSQMVVVDAS
jgi:exosortase